MTKNPENGPSPASGSDATEMLKSDHRHVEQLFSSFEKATDNEQKSQLAEQICTELMVHTLLEEEIFYPACRGHMEQRLLEEAQVEHDGAKTLLIEIKTGSPTDQYFDAKVKVLSEEIKHHVREEEKPDGVLAKAKQAGVATPDLAKRMAALKHELMGQAKAGALGPPEIRSFRVRTFAGMHQLTQEHKMARGSSMTMERERDERGRFVSDDEDDRDYRRRSSSRSRYDDDDDDRRSSRSRSMPARDDEGRFTSSRSRYDVDDDDRRSSRRVRAMTRTMTTDALHVRVRCRRGTTRDGSPARGHATTMMTTDCLHVRVRAMTRTVTTDALHVRVRCRRGTTRDGLPARGHATTMMTTDCLHLRVRAMTRTMMTGVAAVGTGAGTAISRVTPRHHGAVGTNVAVRAAAIAMMTTARRRRHGTMKAGS